MFPIKQGGVLNAEGKHSNKQTNPKQCRNEINLPLKFHVSKPTEVCPHQVSQVHNCWKPRHLLETPKTRINSQNDTARGVGVSRAHIWGLCHCPGQTAYGDPQRRTGSRGAFFLCAPRALAFDDWQSFSKCHLFTVTILNFTFKNVLTYNNLGLSRTFSFCIPNIVD